MTTSSRLLINGDDGAEFLWNDGERIFSREQRPNADGKRDTVLSVSLTTDHPASASLDEFAHEYALRDELESTWAARPLELIRDRDRTLLILEDTGSSPLEQLLGGPMEIGRFLHLATAITTALMQLHRRGLIHKNVKPSNILINAEGEVRLTGFGIASRLSRERQQLERPVSVVGTPAYMAPEQIGRMNRSIDSRSDLYALGVTLYHMLTGVLPFTATDAMEWAHCHVARRPVPPLERLVELPGAISAIVMKLLAKTAEERYQTAAGLKRDLQHCLNAWEARGRIEDFVLGRVDTLDRLLIPEKLYGREPEIESLLASFDSIGRSDATKLILVSGYSGVGKSALVRELHSILVARGGLFASGKFDQHQRDIPCTTLGQTFQSLIRGLLAKNEADLSLWRESLRQALGPLGQLMVNLVPELTLVIGDQLPVPDASPEDAHRRFQLVVRRFIGVFAKPGHPLALFLDDLQWMDLATLDLIEALLAQSDLQNLMLIGAYRENEVDAKHPLRQRLEAIRKLGLKVQEISLAPLARDAVEQFVADTLHCECSHSATLAWLLHEKTGGNPFFLIQFLHALSNEGLLTFDHDKVRWCWDLGRVHAEGYTENVANLVIDKMSGLRDETRQALVELACLGSHAEAKTLSSVHGTSEQQLYAILEDAARLQLVQLLDDSYVFVHDRVQEAAYALEQDEDKRAALHLRIGVTLAAHLSPDETSEKVYLVANQLNRGLTALVGEAEREQIITVNLVAGRRARNAAAYTSAITYLNVTRELLGEKATPRWSGTAFAVGMLHAECEFLVGHLDVAEAELLVLSRTCANLQHSADVARLRAQLYTAAGQVERAVDVCLTFLGQIGVNWSPRPGRSQVDEDRLRVRNMISQLSYDQLHALPPMSDPDHRATMAVLAEFIIPALHTDRNLSDLVLLAATRLTLEHGICPESCFALTTAFGVLASKSADSELGFRLSQFGAALAEKQPQFGLSGRALLAFGKHVTPWVRPIRSGQPFMQRALAICIAVGDLGFAAYAYRGLLSMDTFCGAPLSHICFQAEEALAFAQASGLWISVDVLILQRHLALGLMGRDEEQSFEVPNIIEPHPSEGTQPLNAFLRYVAQIQLNVLAGRHDIALALAELADKISWRFKAYSEFTEYRFYTGLAHAAAYYVSPPEAREKHLDYLREQHRKFTNWSARVPGNFIARKSLLASEIARIEGRELEAQQLYEEAIQSAREAGFVQIEAIAAERAAWFYEARGIRTVVLSYLAHARDCYLRWGAEAKVRQLNDMHPQLREKDSALNFTHTIGAPFEQLDLATVLKVSEAVSGEMVLEKLTDTLLRTAIEHAGAERGVLILPQRTELRVRAEAKASGSSTTVNLLDLPISDADIPESVILYTARMRESVILDDALAPGYFAGDEYLHRKQARSVLCLPLIKQGNAVALLYLENNLAPRAFTPARVTILRFLASQAATSLDNARLYRELQERESRIRRLVEANIIGIFIFGPGYEIVEANDSFLNIVGYDREDLEAGRLHWTKLTPPEGHDRTLRAHTELGASGAVQPFTKEYVRKDGGRVPVLVGVASFEQHDQGVGFVLDLSEQQRAEAEARESEQRYRVAQMELAHANRVAVMGHLTASIAHEVNQPNTAIVASAQAAMRWLDRRPPDVEKARQALARVEQNAMRASEVIGRIRNLIKKTPPRKDCLAINPVIREVIELTHAETTKNGILVRTEFAEHLPNVVGDRVELQQVAVNLILNAIEAMTGMTKGARELLIRTAKTDDEGVLVAVMDSGPGLSATTLDRLFEPFYTTKASGMGVGLSICRSIIEGHGGRLWASANVPHGATFQFVLPTSGHASANLIASARPSRLLG